MFRGADDAGRVPMLCANALPGTSGRARRTCATCLRRRRRSKCSEARQLFAPYLPLSCAVLQHRAASRVQATVSSRRFQRGAGDDSELHIIIFDEIDSVCKARGSSRDGTGVGDSVVNQLLTKIDGVNALNNILLIGMTNRKDLLDEALLRPGRMEVQIEIGLPDEHGRQQILRIKTDSARQNSFMVR